MTYSLDLRTKALEYIQRGKTWAETALVFGVTTRTVAHWVRKNKEGRLAPKSRRSSPSKIEDKKLKECIDKAPDAFLREIAQEFNSSPQAIFYACKRLKITLKKTSILQRKKRRRT